MEVHQAQTLRVPSSVSSIGVFDGVHRGHQALIRQARDRAVRLGVPMVIHTFDPPPRNYFEGAPALTPLPEKLRWLDAGSRRRGPLRLPTMLAAVPGPLWKR